MACGKSSPQVSALALLPELIDIMDVACVQNYLIPQTDMRPIMKIKLYRAKCQFDKGNARMRMLVR